MMRRPEELHITVTVKCGAVTVVTALLSYQCGNVHICGLSLLTVLVHSSNISQVFKLSSFLQTYNLKFQIFDDVVHVLGTC